MDANALQLKDYLVKQVARFGRNLEVHRDWQVTFMLGEHGPFMLSYQDTMPDHATLQADIGKIAQTVRAGASVTV